MLPLVVLLWQSDATIRLAAEQSAQASITTLGQGALVTGGEAAFDAHALDPAAAYGTQITGRYGRVINLAPETGPSTPLDSLSGQLTADAVWQITPRLHLSLNTQNYLASRLGVRAEDTLASRDPFLSGDRLEYTTGGAVGLYANTSRRSTLRLTAGYTQAGALAASDERAVGVDAHAPHASAAWSYDVGPSDTVTPEVRYAYTHFINALYGLKSPDMSGDPYDRHALDVHAVTGLVGETHAFGRRLLTEVQVGVTAATPPPMFTGRALVVAPDVATSMRYFSPRYRIHLSYRYGYTSLGPRVGFGFQHQGQAEVSFRPARGARLRDMQLVAVGRAGFGETPAVLAPMPRSGSSTVGTLRTTNVAVGGRVEYPLLRGLLLFGATDLEYLRGAFDPAPRERPPEGRFQIVATLGIAGILSTDPDRTVLRDPEAEEEEVRRIERGDVAPIHRIDRRSLGGRSPAPNEGDNENWIEREPPPEPKRDWIEPPPEPEPKPVEPLGP